MRYLIIGLGIYGSNLATDLTDMGAEVIGADIRASNVEAIKDYISTAYIVDSTDETSLGVLPLNNIDIAIVAIGENFGASIKTVAILKKHEVKCIYARAIDPLHQSILEGLHVQRILKPEQRAASDLVSELGLGTDVKSMKIDNDSYVMRFKAPLFIIGTLYSKLMEEGLCGLKLVAATRPKQTTNILGINVNEAELIDLSSTDQNVEDNDLLVCFGRKKDFHALYKYIS
ncbi:MAG: NAD-binding protein [Muribaculaceae bacterium]|nr:NAD-binding protein [Muribaculaceae bacterium]